MHFLWVPLNFMCPMKGIKNENDGKKSLHGIRRNRIRRNEKTPRQRPAGRPGNLALLRCLFNRSLENSLQFSVTRILMKIFKTRLSDIVIECQNYFDFYTISTLIRKRKATFLHKLVNSQNELSELFIWIFQASFNYLAFFFNTLDIHAFRQMNVTNVHTVVN